MDTSKIISLRRKKTSARPTISAPRQIEQRDRTADNKANPGREAGPPTSGAKRDASASRERPRLGVDQTSDLVKRRYSARFTAGGPQDGPAPPVPTMPNLPVQYSGTRAVSQGLRPPPSRDGGKSPERKGRVKIDIRALCDPNLMADKYVQSILADASDKDISGYQRDLQNLEAHTNADLQHNVYQNRTQFIKISKEADKLKSEMRMLRALMNDLTGALSHATSAGGADLNSSSALSITDRKRANRSSVANLEAMWSTHLQTLWKRVEGSQKFLPALPGRHIIVESQRWVELNAATWKPRRRVALVLLNDHLLVAVEKKRTDIGQNGTPTGKGNNRMSVYNPQSSTVFVADRCWPLHDVTLADINAQPGAASNRPQGRENGPISNAINLRAGNESFTYAISDPTEKTGLVVAFRKAQEDLRKQLAVEHGEREKALDEIAYMAGQDPRLLKKAAVAAAVALGSDQDQVDFKSGGLNRSGSVLVDVDGRPQSVRWVESQIDGLDIDIALQRFEEAVANVEKLRAVARGIKGNNAAQEIVHAKVNERASRLANSIARQLRQRSGGMEATKQSVNWLLRLGFEELAMKTYLSSRTETIRVRTRQLPFTGALEPYVHALSFTTITMLVHTFKTFTQSFPPQSSSAVVRWAKERVDEFNSSLERQLTSVDRGSDIWKSCIAVVRSQASALGDIGVDFKGLIAKGLIDDENVDLASTTQTIAIGTAV